MSRVLPPGLTKTSTQAHDAAVLRTLAIFLIGSEATQLSLQAQRAVQLPLQSGGLGLRSAEATRLAAYWASWIGAPCQPAATPEVVARIVDCLSSHAVGGSLLSPRHAQRPSFLPLGVSPRNRRCRNRFVRTSRSGTPPATNNAGLRLLAMRALEMHSANLDSASPPLLLSQAGPYASRALTLLPMSPEASIPCSDFRVLLLRRLRLPLQLAPRARRCRAPR